jgi:NADPH2:quinone reductase
VRGLRVSELGRPPEPAELPEPEGAALEVEAAALNPIDRAVVAGRHYAGHPPLPFVPGCEAVGMLDGRRVWAFSDGLGLRRDGGFAERVHVSPDAVAGVPEGADPVLACALGIAGMAGWMPVAWRAPVQAGDRVLVLGASGTAGTVAVQAAKLLGAAHVVGAGRDRAALERCGADEVVTLDGDFGEPTYVFDPLWGEPAAKAVAAAAPGARIVQLGQSAGHEATLTSATIRGKQLELYGYSNYAVPREVLAREYARLVSHALAGEIRLEIERVPLEGAPGAWERRGKIVLVP